MWVSGIHKPANVNLKPKLPSLDIISFVCVCELCVLFWYWYAIYYIISLFKFVSKERRARVEALRRKMSNQASTEVPKESVPGFSASQ